MLRFSFFGAELLGVGDGRPCDTLSPMPVGGEAAQLKYWAPRECSGGDGLEASAQMLSAMWAR